jgi:hypothetical protein
VGKVGAVGGKCIGEGYENLVGLGMFWFRVIVGDGKCDLSKERVLILLG